MLGTAKMIGARTLFSLIVCTSTFSIGKAQRDSCIANNFSFYGISLGTSTHQMNFDALRSNPYLLHKPNNFVPMADVCFYLGNLNKLFAGFDLRGVWKNTAGAYQNYQSIRVTTAHFGCGLIGYYSVYKTKKITAFALLGTTFARTYLHSRDL